MSTGPTLRKLRPHRHTPQRTRGKRSARSVLAGKCSRAHEKSPPADFSCVSPMALPITHPARPVCWNAHPVRWDMQHPDTADKNQPCTRPCTDTQSLAIALHLRRCHHPTGTPLRQPKARRSEAGAVGPPHCTNMRRYAATQFLPLHSTTSPQIARWGRGAYKLREEHCDLK